MSVAPETLRDLSPNEKRALLARLLREKQRQPKHFPLSYAQQRLWFLHQFDASSPAYNLGSAVRMRGNVAIPALAACLTEIVRRHETLRTTFETVAGEPVQQVWPQLALPLPVIDLSALPPAVRQPLARQLAEADSRIPFDLGRGPLLRAILLPLAEDDLVLSMQMHHIVSDDWSMRVLIQELVELYGSFVTGKAPSLPALPIQYADFAEWQRQWMEGEMLERQLDYWRRQLGDSPPVLELPLDRPRPAVQTFRGGLCDRRLEAGLSAGIRTLARDARATLYMTFLAAFKMLLSRVSGHRKVAVGTPVANRQQLSTEGLIGFFANTLVLSTDLSGDPSFRTLLARVKQGTLQAYEHQDLPFEKLVEELQPERSMSHSPLFQVLFTWREAVAYDELELPGMKLSSFDAEIGAAPFDLTLEVTDAGDGIITSFAYNVDLFDASTVERLAYGFETLLGSTVENPARCLTEHRLLSPAERHQLLREWNDTAAAICRHSSVLPLIEAQADRRGEAVALIFRKEQLSFAHLMARANQLAHDLIAQGVGTGDLVGICAERSPEMVICVLAIWTAGGAYLPLDPESPPERLRTILENARLDRVLIAGSPAAGSPIPWPEETTLVRVDGHCWAFGDHPTTAPGLVPGAESPAYVIYTSGSTGTPKGVVVSHAGIPGLAAAQIERLGLGPGFRVLQFASLGFDASLSEIVMALTSGAALVLAREEERSGRPLRDMLIRKRVTHATLPPVVLPTLEDGGQPPGRGLALETLLVAGEACSGEVVGRWSSSLRMINGYGPTETTVCTTMSTPLSGTGPPPIGRPIWNLRAQVLDAVMMPVPVGVVGELYAAGTSLAQGYQGRADLTAERFVADPWDPSRSKGGRMYRTGDLARWRADGTLEFVGRADRQVKLRGFRIEPGEIEAALRSHEAVRDTVVTVYGETPGEERLVAYVVPGKNEAPPPTSELRTFLAEWLPGYMVPSNVIRLESLPVTANGKVDFRALPSPAAGREALGQEYKAPRSDIERSIADLWRDVLGITQVGREDNFFELGGHSLVMVQVRDRLREITDRELTLTDLFRYPTVSSLASFLSEPAASESAPEERDAELGAGRARLRQLQQRRRGGRPR